jgi:hypothetical protein
MAQLQVFFESSEEQLSDAVVPALTPAAHAAHHAMVGELSLVQVARMLAALVGMMQRVFFWFLASHGIVQGRSGEISPQVVGEGIAYDSPRK